MGEAHSKVGNNRSIPKLAKRNLVARWQNRRLAQQFFAVARHDERADSLYALFNGMRWTQSEDFRKWPFDPPLSDAGVEAARNTGQRMRGIAQSSACEMHIIVSSPYFRCIQTAVEICLAFGPSTRLMVDCSLGEVFGPTVMGTTEPRSPVRPMEHILSYCQSRGVSCYPRVIGKWPTWPENIRDARQRFASIFLTYLQRATVTQRNFMLIGHADCVAASLSLMPSQAEHSIERVDYGGLFFGRRKRKEERPPRLSQKQRKRFASIVPAEDDVDNHAAVVESATPTLLLGRGASHDGWLDDERHHHEDAGSLVGQVALPEAADGWEVFTMNIDLHSKALRSSSSAARSKFNKKVSALAETSHFSRERIKTLLGELSSTPLGDVASEEVVQTSPSISTFIFGASDIGNMSDFGSESCTNSSPGSSITRHSSRLSSRPSVRQSSSFLSSPARSPNKSINDQRLHSQPSRAAWCEKIIRLNSSSSGDETPRSGEHKRPSHAVLSERVARRISNSSTSSLQRVDEKIGAVDFPVLAMLSENSVGHKSVGDLQSFMESSLWRRRRSLCQSLPTQAEQELGYTLELQAPRLDLQQKVIDPANKMRSSVQVISCHVSVPASSE